MQAVRNASLEYDSIRLKAAPSAEVDDEAATFT